MSLFQKTARAQAERRAIGGCVKCHRNPRNPRNPVAGNFFLENGATDSTTGNVKITGSGTVELDGPNTGGAGGSSLTIGGKLTNSSTSGNGLFIGNTALTSADTVTVKGKGGLSNTGDITIEGSASATAELDVTKTATSSGTIIIDAFGDLTATTVNVTGGTLEGVGTVTGTLNDTGGTVVGGSLDGNTGTLTESGAYKQSGSGVLQTDINTGDLQQSSIIAVTGTPGTPGAKGSVNLSGGTLLIDAESSLALNTPYTVMTFGKNHLYGQFGEVETEGSLGSHTGNGDSVNLGNGDTLEVLYNEASGDIQVEKVATPASTTYTWDVGSGTWNASSGADWNPAGQQHDAERHFQCGDWHGWRRNRDACARSDDRQPVDHQRLHAFRRHPFGYRDRECVGRVRRRAVDRRHERGRRVHR